MRAPPPPPVPGAEPRSSLRSRLKLLLGERRRLVVGLTLSSALSALTEAALLAIVAQLAANLVRGGKHVPLSIGPIHAHPAPRTLIIIAFGLTFIRLLLQLPASILPARISIDVQVWLRTRLFHAFSRASWAAQARDHEGQLQETMTSQVMQATAAATSATSLITTGLTFFILVGVAFALNALAAVGVLATAILMFALLRPLRGLGVRRSRKLSRAQVAYAEGVAEAVRVAQETHVFGVAAAQRERIDRLVATSRRLAFQVQVTGKLVANTYQSLIYVALVAGIAVLYGVGRGHAASLGGVVLLLVRAGSSGQVIQANYQGLIQAMPFIERILEAVRRYDESSPADGDLPLPSVHTLAFEKVSFSYRAGRPVLSDVSFEVDGHEAVGIIGPSGAGKSTLIQILLQLRTPDQGSYLINGVPVERFMRADWHRLVSYVPQEPRLLHASVADNIRYYRPLDEEAVERAGRLARIHADVMGWSDGYETIVGPRADAVSGGQQQRICLARALAAQPEVLVLDEPTSALDPHSETLIQESLNGLRNELTLFIIAHRMSTLDICDRVMVIVDGRLVAFDTKALLQEQNSYYRTASMIVAGTRDPTPR